MRRLTFGVSLGDNVQQFMQWVRQCLSEIERASAEDIEAVIGEFKVTGNFTETRTLAADTATLADVRNVLATMITDIKKKGQKRGYAG